MTTLLLIMMLQTPLSQMPRPTAPTPDAPILLSDPIRQPMSDGPILVVDLPVQPVKPMRGAAPEIDSQSAGTALAFFTTVVLLWRRRPVLPIGR